MVKNKQRPAEPSPAGNKPSKTDVLVALLTREQGADLAELAAATGWLPHSVRGALAGSLRKKGFQVTSLKGDGRRVYRITQAEVAGG